MSRCLHVDERKACVLLCKLIREYVCVVELFSNACRDFYTFLSIMHACMECTDKSFLCFQFNNINTNRIQ